ncbi:unnamed protein product, partial [Vitis vinifera]|uniref:Uncharacterized protein n=1 Tax=Vitis vinifera TaxID=29760 RepID=D7T5B1_VITVI
MNFEESSNNAYMPNPWSMILTSLCSDQPTFFLISTSTIVTDTKQTIHDTRLSLEVNQSVNTRPYFSKLGA